MLSLVGRKNNAQRRSFIPQIPVFKVDVGDDTRNIC